MVLIYLQVIFFSALMSMKLAPCDMYLDKCKEFENPVAYQKFLDNEGVYFKWIHFIAGGSMALLIIPIASQFKFLSTKTVW